jgi:luciferase family oxidoreductase group 1
LTQLSILDLVPVRAGDGPADALAQATQYARAAEAEGYHRYWVAEHHGSEGIAGGAVSVVLSHVGAATSSIRIGSGGIMLPNHNPFVIAEQFGTLAALYPGRIDLGLGRAPGAAPVLARALRKDLHAAADRFPHDVVELRALLSDAADLAIHATPGRASDIEMWMLGSSLFGAQLAARLGMPYAFASHFAPDHLDAALMVYRERFEPSEYCEKPHVMAAMTVIAADTDEEAAYLASSQEQSFVALRSGNAGKLPPPVRDYRDSLSPSLRAMLDRLGEARAVGSPATVAEKIAAFVARTKADEIVCSGATFDPDARIRSLRLAQGHLKGRVPA